MTRFDPTLIVTRLVVERNGRPVYDEHFHQGVNIIRGENSSGKSTILNFIYYGLGGDLFDWSEVALLCTNVYVEVQLNGKLATLRRDISSERGQPMDIFGGDYESSKASAHDHWLRYPYARSQSRESFSRALFRLLEIPEVVGEQSGNVTIHQILRLLYSDQLSPVENLFRFERFDPPALRDTVGRLLCGAYDSQLYSNELKIRSLQKDYDDVSAELSSLLSVAQTDQQPLTLEWIAAEKRRLSEEKASLQEKIEQAERQLFVSSKATEISLKAQEQAYAEVQRLQRELEKAKEARDALMLTIADSSAFIASLENKIAALGDASAVADHIGQVHFQSCPACYAPIQEDDATKRICHLCKTPFDSEQARTRIVALANDAAIQLKQSQSLQAERKRKMDGLEQAVAELRRQWGYAANKLSEFRNKPSSDASTLVSSLTRKAGYLDRQIENIEERAKLVAIIEQRSERKAKLSAEISGLKDRNEALRSAQQERLTAAYTAIADEIRDLLRNDLRRQDSFEDPKSIEFDFLSNKISVDGQSYFSASSRVILRSSFFVGFFVAATKNRYFRHPRFCMVDTIEDKGMEPQRSYNFQHLIAAISGKCNVDHQIIFATAMISPDLDDDRYTIGKFSTRDSPTIAIQDLK